ncbi:hypothetical protein [Paenibacillus cellulositrophicus]
MFIIWQSAVLALPGPESPEERNMFREVIDNADQPIVQNRLH